MGKQKRIKFRYVEYTGRRPKMPNCDGLVSIVKSVSNIKDLTLDEKNTLLDILLEVEENHRILLNTRREELKRIALDIQSKHLPKNPVNHIVYHRDSR